MANSMTALGYFKDWTNVMLVTTTAAMGWVAKTAETSMLSTASVVFLALSIACAVFTLALIPLVAEQITGSQSIYDVKARFNLFWVGSWEMAWRMKYVCWPQHVFFLLGIGLYACSKVFT